MSLISAASRIRTLIHPEQSRAVGLARGVAGDHGAGRAVEADAGDLTGLDVILGQREPNRVAGGRPPRDRLLLGPGRPRIGRLDRRDPHGNGSTVQRRPGPPAGSGSRRPGPVIVGVEPCQVSWEMTSFDQRSIQADFRLSSRNVTGPSFTSSIFIMARKTPVATSRPDSASRSAQSR